MGASLPLCLFILWRHSCPLVKWLKLVCALEICAWSSHSHCRVKRELERRGNAVQYEVLASLYQVPQNQTGFLRYFWLPSRVQIGKCGISSAEMLRSCSGQWETMLRVVKEHTCSETTSRVFCCQKKKKKEKKSSPFARNWTRVKFENKLICSKRRLPESPVWLCATRRYFVWFAPCGYRAVLSKGRSLPSPCVKTGARHFNASLLCVVCLSCKSPHGLLYGFRMVTQN